MINTDELHNFFDEIIIADSNPFTISYVETYKESGEIKTKKKNELLELKEIDSILDLIENDNIKVLDYYPKTFFKKIFNIRGKCELKFDGDENNFVFMSEKTSKLFKTNCKTYNLNEDNKIIIGKRSRLIIYQKEGKTFTHLDKENFRTIIIK